MNILVLMIPAILLTVPASRQPAPEAKPPASAETPARTEPRANAATPEDTPTSSEAAARIDTILTKLQQRSDGLADIRCNVRFVEEDQINLTKRTKIGRLLFKVAEPNPLWVVHFDRTEADGVLGKRESFLFDGRWLYEASERLEQVTQREWVREGETVDFFDLESAPFPVPFGQKKEKILKNFTVTLIAPAPGDPPDTDHLVCVPKPDSPLKRRFDKLEMFVRKDIHLPSRIIVTKNEGLERNTADFDDLSEKSINTGVTEKDFAHPKEWKKYEWVIEAFDSAEASPP